MTLGEKLRSLRRKQGFQQYELAELAGVSRASLAKWELGLTRPRQAAAERVVKALGVPYSELVGNEQLSGNSQGNPNPKRRPSATVKAGGRRLTELDSLSLQRRLFQKAYSDLERTFKQGDETEQAGLVSLIMRLNQILAKEKVTAAELTFHLERIRPQEEGSAKAKPTSR